MSRLSDLAGKLPRSFGSPTKGYGYKVWDTRRANKFLREVGVLTGGIDWSLPVLQLAAHAVSESIAERLPGATTALPRGYTVVLNSQGEPALALRDTLLNPGYTQALPDELTIRRFGQDLKTGFLTEIAEFLKTRAV